MIFCDMVSEILGIKAYTKKEDIGHILKIVKLKLWEILERNGHCTRVKEKVEEFIGGDR
ncbi:Variable outer membrane protein (plasmid) [Borrelia crocidurae DOU]|uniref:Variable large protein n=1 Tax=Borrelia crocidurae DOU TaxID=1293575 RepID=W5SS60_9SPIR|nr:Variable outer membrane protein [Borrelia crocidurae DOU]